jgi:hypothetical protein
MIHIDREELKNETVALVSRIIGVLIAFIIVMLIYLIANW